VVVVRVLLVQMVQPRKPEMVALELPHLLQVHRLPVRVAVAVGSLQTEPLVGGVVRAVQVVVVMEALLTALRKEQRQLLEPPILEVVVVVGLV
jgi:hypothetical protein